MAHIKYLVFLTVWRCLPLKIPRALCQANKQAMLSFLFTSTRVDRCLKIFLFSSFENHVEYWFTIYSTHATAVSWQSQTHGRACVPNALETPRRAFSLDHTLTNLAVFVARIEVVVHVLLQTACRMILLNCPKLKHHCLYAGRVNFFPFQTEKQKWHGSDVGLTSVDKILDSLFLCAQNLFFRQPTLRCLFVAGSIFI